MEHETPRKESPKDYFDWFKSNPPGNALLLVQPEGERVFASIFYSGMIAGVNFAGNIGVGGESYDAKVLELMKTIRVVIYEIYGGGVEWEQ